MRTVSSLRTIIVVEDSDEDFDTVSQAVHHAGLMVNVQRAMTGGDCLDLLGARSAIRPAVVLMDLNTPGVDGREALAAIKGDSVLKLVSVVVFSTSDDPRDRAFCYAAGANAYHVKPIRYPDHLQLLIDVLLYWLKRVTLPYLDGASA
ncbi:CheY chemotaxis protein or a CheY-like REC (receiver) domain [Duganella sp. CF517]|uniref:response regulator n=1 Tax=Duganella sp. CF517 TaxID=1881038 RepID=UPI0008D35901|nr:response regulator [Duganella sp. CF517]SEO04423.1 CheY chemotaxis protein or a CheY-like REC (receiver) domain [Duganella sp. CF517]